MDKTTKSKQILEASRQLPDRPEFRIAPSRGNKKTKIFAGVFVGVILAIVTGVVYRYFYPNGLRAKVQVQLHQRAQVVNPYAGWKTYASPTEKATFKYPSNWTITTPNQGALNGDQAGVLSPSGAIKISWSAELGGYGNEQGTNYPLQTIVGKTPISGAPGLYVVSGITTLDGTTYHPWIAVQDDQGILSAGVGGDVLAFQGRHAINETTDDFTDELFATSGLHADQFTPSLTKAQATAWFFSPEAKQAKLIFLSLNDPSNPAANWYLYVSPGNHYAVRLPDGWNLNQNCTGSDAALETYYEGYNGQNTDPLALRPGIKATVTNQCFGKDGNPLINFAWYDLTDQFGGAQKLLASFSATDGLQKQGSFQTDSGQTVDKYYMNKTTPPQNIMQLQVGTYYDYLIQNSAGFVWVLNFYPPGAVDRHDVVEAAIKTLVLH